MKILETMQDMCDKGHRMDCNFKHHDEKNLISKLHYIRPEVVGVLVMKMLKKLG